jgi:hypothetical protein
LAALLITPQISHAAEPEFACTISSERATYKVGEAPALNVRILNKSSAEVHLVGALDGSEVGWRFPKCRLEILDSAGKAVVEPYGRCGNMNTLRPADFVAVPAAGEFNPFGKGFFGPHQLYRFPVKTPGTYTVRFFYSTAARSIEEFFGDERMLGQQGAAPEIQRLFDRVPKLDLKSNDLKLTFTAK